MKGMIKGFQRTPHMLTSRIGMSAKSSDPEFDELNRRFGSMEIYADKLHKDAICFRDSINTMITSSSSFAEAFLAIFTPGGKEYDLESRFPGAAETIKQIGAYQADMAELKESLAPEVELIESRIIAPAKEFVDTLKKIRKSITKRDHKLIDFDRHNNSFTKLREKQNKSLSDEKNMFKIEQDFEQASQDYEFHNTALKNELPRFFELATAFITPLFQSFYYMQLQCIYVMVEKMQSFTGNRFDLSVDVEAAYAAKAGDAPERMEDMTITKRIISTNHMMRAYGPGAGGGKSDTGRPSSIASRPSISTKPSLNRAGSSSFSSPQGGASGTAAGASAPPPYSPSSSPGLASSSSIKRAPPPPPAARSKPASPPVEVAVALYDFAGQTEGDLSFEAGSRIEIVQKTESTEDWWTGRLDGRVGQLPANYVQLQ